MKLYRITSPGTIDALSYTNAPEPAPGPRDLLVKLSAFSLNFRDLLTVEGRYGGKIAPGLIPLSDGAGEVVAVGDAVTLFKVGDRVAGCFFENWQDGALDRHGVATARGGAIDGLAAEYAAVPETSVVAIPAGYSDAEAATLPCAALTAWHALVDYGHVAAGQTVLVQGTGGVSLFAIQFARAMGAEVIATSSREEGLEKARALGATGLVNYRTHPEWAAEVLRLTGRRGVDLTVEVGGSNTLAQSLQATVQSGKIAVIGVLTGAGSVDPMPILARRLSLQGILVGSRVMFEAMNRAIVTSAIRPVIDRSFAFAELPEAYRHLKSASHIGKIVVEV